MAQSAAQALFEQNRSVMSHFKVGANVVLHPQPARLDNKMYGTITGFRLNCLDEVVLVIKVAVKEDPEFDEVQVVHPFNGMLVTELV